MKLLVIRHAVAMERGEFQVQARAEAREHGAKSGVADDDFRPLTEEGAKKMRKNAKGLKNLAGTPLLLVSSPLTRALQTSEILRDVSWPELDLATSEQLRPASNPAELCRWLNSLPPASDSDGLIAIVGHEPHLSSLVSWFMNGSAKSLVELKKGGACLLDFPAKFEKGKGRLQWLAPPSLLRASR